MRSLRRCYTGAMVSAAIARMTYAEYLAFETARR
jgi:hypothetical protein